MTQRATSVTIDEAAAEWAVRAEQDSLTESECAELDAWLAADTRHLGAYARACAVLDHASRIKALGEDFSDARDIPVKNSPEPRVFARRIAIGKAVAVLTAVAASMVLFFVGPAETLTRDETVYATAAGEMRTVTLPDGSSVTLNTGSRIAVSFDDRRHVHLIEGEALFTVRKDRARPFVVAAGDTHVSVLGTVFTVRQLPDRPIEVVVREGRVRVDQAGLFVSSTWNLTPREQLVIDDQPMLALIPNEQTVAARPLEPGQLDRELAWLDGRIAFEDVALSAAAAEFARYGGAASAFR